MRVFGIIGYPLEHSFSQKYFTEKFQREEISDCVYKTYPIRNIAELEGILKQRPQPEGLNITIPHKQAVLSFLDDSTNIPFGLNACNCIRITNGRLVGYNTDVIGFERSLSSQLNTYHTKALILGNGGAAEAVKFVLKQLNINYKIVSRKIHKDAELTYADLDENIIKENLLIINTTPVGTFPAVDEYPEIPYQYLTPKHFLYDLVYNPEKTLFLKKGEEHGAAIKNGYEMLVVQAEESWDIWNGIL